MRKIGKKLAILSSMFCVTTAGCVHAADLSYTTNFGDANGDSKINVLDMEAIQKDLLGIATLDDAVLNDADPDRNGIVNVLDMEAIQKQLLQLEDIENITVIPTQGTVSVHDPSIIKDEKTGEYYIFGSHLAWAKSTDLCNWTTFENNINDDFKTIFAAEAAWAAKANSSYDVSGNLWAPDVIWNEDMQKWCMYMSINGPKWNSTISLLTADSLDGDWTYVGPVIQSGMTNGYGKTFDYTKVTGETTVNSRYTSNIRNGNPTYEPHAIDPCVTYDEDGNLWMSYGSWSGGIGMIQLDKETGLRDYDVTYTLDETTLTDPYTGYKIAGGNQASGEASYIEKIGNYYYLFMSYGGLVANGGYSMRIFRSEDITGPYVDESGDYARYKLNDKVIGSTGVGNITGTTGIRLMTYYKWDTMDVAQVAQGHNSAFVDEDGKAYVVYHTRTNDGSEGHYVKTHQLFINEDGWLVAAPYRYSGETLKEEGYSKSSVTGTYEVLMQKQNTNHTALSYETSVDITLNSDGTVEGAYTGTWSLTEGTPYITIVMGGKTYKGVVIRQIIEGTDEDTMCFTLLGTDDEMCVWGSQYLTGNRAIDYAMEHLTVVTGAVDDVNLPLVAGQNTSVTWSSDNTAVIADDGTFTRPEEETVVTLTATFKNGSAKKQKDYKVTVYPESENSEEPYIIAKYLDGQTVDLSQAYKGTYQLPNPFSADITAGLDIYNGAAIEFDVALTGSMDRLDAIFGFNDAGSGKLFFTAGSYLGFNNGAGQWYDANMKNWALQQNFLGNGARVRIDFIPTGYKVSVNGTVVYTNATVDAGTTAGTNSVTSYATVLKWLSSSAKTLHLGNGTFWAQSYKGTIGNIVFYAYPVEKIDTSMYAYYEGYEKSDISMWTSANAQGFLTVGNDGDTYGNYMHYAPGNQNSRGAVADFADEGKVSGKYTLEFDLKLTAGSGNNPQESQFAVTTVNRAYTDNNMNNGIANGYLFKLSANNSTTWTINNGATVVIPKATWVHITAEVDTDAGTTKLTIANGDTILYTGTVSAVGAGTLDGMYIRGGRYNSVTCVDTIAITQN